MPVRKTEVRRAAVLCSNEFRAGIYCRLSVEEKDKKEEYSSSIHAQIMLAEDFICRQKNVVKVQVYAGDGISGGNFRRAEFRRMLADIELGIINMVVVKDIFRLGREHIETSYYLGRYFPEKRVRVVSLMDRYDSEHGIYDDIMDIRILMNDMYIRDISEKIRASIRAKRISGEYTPGESPYGYVKSKTGRGHLEPDRYAAEIVRRIYGMYLKNKGCTAISHILNGEKIPLPAKYKKERLGEKYVRNPGRGLWTPDAVRRILKNPVYTGSVVINRSGPGIRHIDRKKSFLSDGEMIKNAHEAIISEMDFLKTQEIMEQHRNLLFEKNRKPHKYAGILFCGKCGAVMRKRYLSSQNGFDGYVCGLHQQMGREYCELNQITFEKLDQLISYALSRQIERSSEKLKSLSQQIWRKKGRAVERYRILEAGKERAAQNRRRCYEQFMNDMLSRDQYLEVKKKYDKEEER